MVLITGATGFIGSHFLRRAVGQWPFRCLSRTRSLPELGQYRGIEIAEADLLDPSPTALRNALAGVHTILHLAGLIRRNHPREVWRVNVDGTQALVQGALQAGVARFIFVSSENALREDLNDAYSESKRQAEVLVRTFPRHLILRPSFVYGPGDDHGLGRIIERVRNAAWVPLFGGLEACIQPLYVEDMAEYLIRALSTELEGEFLLTGSETLSLNEFIRKVCDRRPKKRVFVTVPRSVLNLSAKLADRLPWRTGWGSQAFRNIYYHRIYKTDEALRVFGFKPRGVDEGLKSWLGSD